DNSQACFLNNIYIYIYIYIFFFYRGKDVQCGVGLCCAVSLWLRGLRMCTPQGLEGDECHPYSHKVPFPGKRQHHTCPCLPHLVCTRYSDKRYRCTSDFKNIDF
uniref:Prokineticin 1 n=1 Tax=Sinocyclocheilus rhinocerous TaxID=307959 RepID=A0A673I8D1_9TELE